MEQLLIFLLIIVAMAIIVLVLMQQGKGADAGAAFGSGASNTVFGSQGSGSFLMKLTLVFVGIFFLICIILARIAVIKAVMAQNVAMPTQQSQSNVPPGSMGDVPKVPQNS